VSSIALFQFQAEVFRDGFEDSMFESRPRPRPVFSRPRPRPRPVIMIVEKIKK